MAAQVLPFPKATLGVVSPIACFVRIGGAHPKLADLHAEGHLPARHVVIDASQFRNQHGLVSVFREIGAEIVLDTEVAELAAPAKYTGRCHQAPWASADGPLGPDNFRKSAPSDVVGQIARFAVQNHVSTVLAPAHFLSDPTFNEWLSIDREACLALRTALDREGGNGIAIDYPVIVSNTTLNDISTRGLIVATLSDLPVDNVWVRASGLGSDAGPLTMRRYLDSIAGLHNLGKPIIGDYIGGIAGMAALAFGAISGIGLGIGERERFDAGSWHKLPKPKDGDAVSGRAVRVSVPGLHRSVTRNELELLMSAKGGRRLCGCGDRACCPHGSSDMTADPRRHAAHQLFKSMSALEAVPDLRRESYFLGGPMTEADRLARQVKLLRPSQADAERLKVDSDALMRNLGQHSMRLEKLRATLERVHEMRGDEGPRAHAVMQRGFSESMTRRQP